MQQKIEPVEVQGGAGLVRGRRENDVAILTLSSPASRNALSLAMLDALGAAVAEISADPTIAAAIITAEGPVFSAGHDLKELTRHREDPDGGRGFFELTMTRCAAVMQAIVHSPKSFIAAVQGTATAAGCQLVASVDLAVASRDAKFCTPGVNIGLFCSTPMVALSRNVPRKRAMEMLLLGELIDAEDAADYGLVNRVVAADQVMLEAMALAERIASKSRLTIAIGKEAFYRQAEMALADAYSYAARVMVENMLARDAAEGIGAFLEKRSPVWTGE